MRRLFFIFFFFLSLQLKSQEVLSIKGHLSPYIIYLSAGVGVEYKTKTPLSFQVIGNYRAPLFGLLGENYKSIIPEIRYYFKDEVEYSMFVGLYVDNTVRNLGWDFFEPIDYRKEKYHTIGLLLGINVAYESRCHIDMYLGYGQSNGKRIEANTSNSGSAPSFEDSFSRYAIRAGFNVNYKLLRRYKD